VGGERLAMRGGGGQTAADNTPHSHRPPLNKKDGREEEEEILGEDNLRERCWSCGCGDWEGTKALLDDNGEKAGKCSENEMTPNSFASPKKTRKIPRCWKRKSLIGWE